MSKQWNWTNESKGSLARLKAVSSIEVLETQQLQSILKKPDIPKQTSSLDEEQESKVTMARIDLWRQF